MRIFFIAALGAFLLGCSPGNSAQVPPQDIVRRSPVQPFPEATEVRLLVDSGKYDREGQPIFTHPDGKRLSAAQRKVFEAAIWIETPIKVSEDWVTSASCFIPHHFFEYYDASGHKLGEVMVCFCCAGIQVSPATRLRLSDQGRLNGNFAELTELVASMGEPTDIQCD